jgi:hypothetical protein
VSVTGHGDDATERKRVEDTAKEEGMGYPCFLDVDGKWSAQADAGGIPAFLLIGKDGRLAHRFKGKLTEGPELEALAASIEQALERPAPGPPGAPPASSL